MSKLAFLLELNKKLSALPQEEREERLHFYSEMIEDRMEEGVPEDEAVSAIGPVETIASQILADFPQTQTVVAERDSRKRLRGWGIVLLIAGAPLWLSLLIAAFAVILSLYICLWAAVICLWAAFASLAAGGLCSLLAGILCGLLGHELTGFALLGAACLCAGLGVFLFFGSKTATWGVWKVPGWIMGRRKAQFMGKGAA